MTKTKTKRFIRKPTDEDRCVAITAKGTRCWNWKTDNETGLCDRHTRHLSVIKEIEQKTPKTHDVTLSDYNVSRIAFLRERREYTFHTDDQVIDWLFRKTKESDRQLRFLLDVWESENRHSL